MKSCKICGRELDVTLIKISVCLDNKLESFCMGCERKIPEYYKKLGKKPTPILTDDDWKELLGLEK